MKKFIIIFILFISTQAFAFTKMPIPVIGISNTDMGSMFNLETGVTPLKAVLDCQSFLHGLNLFQKNNQGEYIKEIEFYLYESECHKIYDYVKKQDDQNKTSCIVLDLNNKSFELYESCEKAAEHS
jgi:hypothetical protein